MTNYYDFKSDKVKEFHEIKEKGSKKLMWFVVGMFFVYIILIVAEIFDQLSIELLFFGLFCTFVSIVWYVNAETTDLHNRINIIDEEIENLK